MPDHVKHVPDREHVITRSKPKIRRQVVRQEKQAHAGSNYRPQPKPIDTPMQIYPRETDTLDIDLLEHHINIDVEIIPHVT